MTLSIVASAPFMATFDRRRMLLVALTVAAAGHFGAAVSVNYPVFSAFRLLAGCGEGAMVASMSAAIAGTRQPDRWFAVYLTCNMIVSTIFFRMMPLLQGSSAATAIYACLGTLTVACLMCLPAFPRRGRPHGTASDSSAGSAASVAQLLRQPPILLSLIGTLVFFTGIGMAWPLMGQIGVSFGLTSVQVAEALAMSVVAGAVAGVFTSWLGTRLGRRVPLLLSTAGIVVSLLLLVLRGVAEEFALAAATFMSAWVASTAYYMGSVAALDGSGRVSTFGVAMQSTGLFIGPAIAAAVIGGGRYHNALWGGVALCSIAVVAMFAADYSRDHVMGKSVGM
jgi:predicted MFS family arabinose efflux permease